MNYSEAKIHIEVSVVQLHVCANWDIGPVHDGDYCYISSLRCKTAYLMKSKFQ